MHLDNLNSSFVRQRLHTLLGLACVQRHERVVLQTLREKISAGRIRSYGQARCIAAIQKVSCQAWNFKKNGNSVTFLNLRHGIIESPTMKVVRAAVGQPEECDVSQIELSTASKQNCNCTHTTTPTTTTTASAATSTRIYCGSSGRGSTL